MDSPSAFITLPNLCRVVGGGMIFKVVLINAIFGVIQVGKVERALDTIRNMMLCSLSLYFLKQFYGCSTMPMV